VVRLHRLHYERRCILAPPDVLGDEQAICDRIRAQLMTPCSASIGMLSWANECRILLLICWRKIYVVVTSAKSCRFLRYVEFRWRRLWTKTRVWKRQSLGGCSRSVVIGPVMQFVIEWLAAETFISAVPRGRGPLTRTQWPSVESVPS
jgi:hypothetical protein